MPNFIYTKLSGLQRVLSPLHGGIRGILFIDYRNVIEIAPVDPVSYTVKYITVKTGTTFCTVRFPDQSKAYNEQQKTADGGDYMDITINIPLPGESKANHLLLDTMKRTRFIALVTTQSGLVRVIGTITNPAKMMHTYDSGASSGTRNASDLQFIWSYEDKPPLFDPNGYIGAVTLPPVVIGPGQVAPGGNV